VNKYSKIIHNYYKSNKGWMDPWINFDSNNINLETAKAGFRKRIPGKIIYAVRLKEEKNK